MGKIGCFVVREGVRLRVKGIQEWLGLVLRSNSSSYCYLL